jgi:glycosyltransferase involved in cell wall biosynthesis
MNLQKSKTVSIVVPIYNEEKVIDIFNSLVKKEFIDISYNYEIIYCLDPSNDQSESIVRNLVMSDKGIKLIKFSRRFGQAAAILAGINHACGDAIIIMDVDLQDPPSLIPKLIESWESDNLVVIAKRSSRFGEPFSKKIAAKIGYRFLNKFSDVSIPTDAGDFRLIDRKIANEIGKYRDSTNFLRGIIASIGFKTSTITFERPARVAGHTKYNKWFGSLKIAFNGIVGYSSVLLNLSSIIGITISFFAFSIALVYGFYKIKGFDFPLGNPTVVISLLFMGGINLTGIGILGLYIARIYDDVKDRPKYIIEEFVQNLDLDRDSNQF